MGTSRSADDRLVRAFSPKEGERAELLGEIDKFRLHNESNGWGFGSLWVSDAKAVVPFTGNVEELYDRARVTVLGTWQHSDRFGWQIKATAVLLELPNTTQGVQAWLCDRFPDIGPVRARAMLIHFGGPDGLWAACETGPEALLAVEGLGEVLSRQVVETYQLLRFEREAYIALAATGLRGDVVRAAVGRWGGETLQKLEEDPYRLLELSIVSWKEGDAYARRAGVSPTDPRRIARGFGEAMRQFEGEGSTVSKGKPLCAKAAGGTVLGLRYATVAAEFPVRPLEAEVLVEVVGGLFARPRLAGAERKIAEKIGAWMLPGGG